MHLDERGSSAASVRLATAFGGAAVVLVLMPALFGYGGPFIDELYYVSCAERPAWGYVDHPPLAPALLRISRAVLGDGMLALRLPPALAAGVLTFGVSLLARRLGGGATAQALAGGALLTAPFVLVLSGFFSMNAFELVLWCALCFLMVEIELRAAPRLWLLFGLVAGVALLNKHTVVLLAAGLGAGMVVTPARRHLAGRWLWIGVALAGLLLLPNLLWQIEHGWPSLEFYRNASMNKQTRLPWSSVLALQVVFASPGALPVWIAGLVLLWSRAELRHLGVAYLVLLGSMVVTQESRPDRIAGLYPLLFAAGGVRLERSRLFAGRRRLALVAWIAVWGAILAPLSLPILSPETTARWATSLGVVPQLERGAGKRTELPQWFADRYGWQQLVEDVARTRERLTPEEQSKVIYFAPSYGHAGALEWLGRGRRLGPVYSTHNTFYLWGPPRDPVDVAIVMGNRREALEELFEEVSLGVVHDCGFCMPWRNMMPIWIARRARGSIAARWPEWKHFE